MKIHIELEREAARIMRLQNEQIERAVSAIMYQEMKWRHVFVVSLFPKRIRKHITIGFDIERTRFCVKIYGREFWYEFEAKHGNVINDDIYERTEK